MADEDRGRALPQRAQGEARAGPPPAASESSPLLSDELRERMQAAVTAERTGAAVTAEPERPPKPERAANAGPIAEDDITEWLGPAAGLPKPTMHGHSGIVGRKPAAPARTGASTAPRPRMPKKPGRPPRARRIVVPLVVISLAIGALAVAAVRHFARPPGSGPTSAAVGRQEAAARNEAATWVARQVSRDAVVSCDRVMCAALTAHGFPSRDLLVLGPTSPSYPVSSAVVVETAAVQDLFGSSLATAWAPAVLASFGSGPAAITVRVVAPHGAAAYQTALSTDLADRKSAGTALLNDPQIIVPALAGAQLSEGQVDSRLLVALAALAGHKPIRIVQFGNTGPGASVGVPLRLVDLAENDRAAQLPRAAYVKSIRAYLSTVKAKSRPATMTTVVLANGQVVLRVEVAAPSPLGVFGPQGSS